MGFMYYVIIHTNKNKVYSNSALCFFAFWLQVPHQDRVAFRVVGHQSDDLSEGYGFCFVWVDDCQQFRNEISSLITQFFDDADELIFIDDSVRVSVFHLENLNERFEEFLMVFQLEV